MLKSLSSFVLFYFICLTVISAQGGQTAFKELRAIEGAWVVKSDNSIMTETWIYVNDSLFEGTALMTDLNGNVLFSERLAIRKMGNSIKYIASVSNQNNSSEIPFELTSSINKVFIFENPNHDFPQRIVYDISSDGGIKAYIEGEIGGKKKRSDFNFVASKR